jgi:hypothetical protein
MMKLIVKYSLILLSAFLVWSCNDKEAGLAKIQVSLIDAPADYDGVKIDIQDVQVNVSGDAEKGWQSLGSAEMGIYDLLKLTNGEEAFLGEIELPEGSLSQVRLILGSNNELIIGSTVHQLTVPSGSQSGLKLNVKADIKAGITYKLIIDFDAAKSIVAAGNSGKYNLKPVIRANFEAATGAIKGVVSPVTVAAVIYAIQGADSVSTFADDKGEYILRALPAGSYDVVAIPSDASSFTKKGITGVNVEVGKVTTVNPLIFN